MDLSKKNYLEFIYHICCDCSLLSFFLNHQHFSHLSEDLIEGSLTDVLLEMQKTDKRPFQHLVAYIYHSLRYHCQSMNQWEKSNQPTVGDFELFQSSRRDGFYIQDPVINWILSQEMNTILNYFSFLERRILFLRFCEEYSYADMSKALNIPGTTIYNLVHLLKNRLTRQLVLRGWV